MHPLADFGEGKVLTVGSTAAQIREVPTAPIAARGRHARLDKTRFGEDASYARLLSDALAGM